MTPTLTLRLRAKTYFSEGGPRIISASSAESRQSLIAKLETTLRQSITLLLVTHVTYALHYNVTNVTHAQYCIVTNKRSIMAKIEKTLTAIDKTNGKWRKNILILTKSKSLF